MILVLGRDLGAIEAVDVSPECGHVSAGLVHLVNGRVAEEGAVVGE